MSIYWAAEPADKLASEVVERFKDYHQTMEGSGRMGVWQAAARRYYGQDSDGGYARSSAVSFGGEQGELALLQVNHFRSLIQSILAMTTAQRPAFEATPINDDWEASQQVSLAEAVWAYELEEGGVERACHSAAERSQVFGEGWVFCGWDANGGEVVAVDQPEPVIGEDGMLIEQPAREIKSGELVVESYSPVDVARDLDASSIRAASWYILRRRTNRWDLAAQFPEHAQDILNSESVDAASANRPTHRSATGESDQCFVLELFHDRTPALPEGRYALICGDEVLIDSGLPYPDLPLHPCLPAEEMGGAAGYSSSWDLLGLSEAYDAIMSGILTTADAGSVPNWIADKKQEVEVRDLEGRLQLVQYRGDGVSPPPGVLPGPKIDPGQIRFAELLQQLTQTLSGVSSVVRGDPEASLKSGAALALVSSMSVQHNSAFQRAYAHLLQSVATAVIRNYARFLSSEKIVEIAGRYEAGSVKSFTAEDLRHVKRIKVELGNPLLRTMAGREQIASILLERFPNKISEEQYLHFLSTGRLEATYRAPKSRITGLREEVDRLLQGLPVRALATDYHVEHITEHSSLLDKPEVRYNDELAGPILAHIMEHIQLLKNTDQALLQATGQPIPDAAMPPPPMPPGPPGPPGPMPPPMAGPPPVPGADALLNQPTPGMPNLPNMPTNPATGAPVPVPGGIAG